MTYKSILTVLTSEATANAPLAQSAALATSFEGHAEALCLGVDRTQTGYYYAGANALVLQETMSRAKDDAAKLQSLAEDTLKKTGCRYSTDAGIAQIADMGRHVARLSRFSDLVVLGKPYGEGVGVEAEPVVEAALFEGRAPVLVTPEENQLKGKPKTVLIAWNESIEAMTAIRRALPLLITADLVRIVVIDPPQHGPERSDPGGMLAQMLARHGVKCEIDVLSKTLPRVSDLLIRHTTDTNADLIVMGAYGHSRFREAILGGATRNMLEKATVPVLMAH